MPHPRGVATHARLSNKLVRSLPPASDGQYIVRDERLPGFFVVVGRRARTYTIQCDVRALGRRRTVRQSIGRAEEWDADEARKEAKARLGALQTGAAEATPRRGALTLRQAWARYQAHLERRVAAGERSRRTVHGYQDCIERLLADWLDTPLRELSEAPALVADRHQEITRENGSYAANHAMRSLRAVYNHARRRELDRGLPEGSPVRSVEFNTESRRDTGMGRAELSGWYNQLRALPNPVRRAFHLLMLLSGSRPDALRRARWEDVSWERRVLHFPDPKGGARRAFDMPLSRPMLACLRMARRAGRVLHPRQAETFIFPADTPTGHISETKEDRSKLSRWGGDLRQTYRTAAQAAGLGEMDVHLLMNHSLGGVNAGYITRGALLDHLIAQQERVSRYLVSALRGRDT